MKGIAMNILDPLVLTALAALVSAAASLVWAIRRSLGKD